MSAILKFDFQKGKQLRFSEVNTTQKRPNFLHVATTFSLKQGETRTSHGPIPHPLISQIRPSWILWPFFDSPFLSGLECSNEMGQKP